MTKKSIIAPLLFGIINVTNYGCNKENRDAITTTTATIMQVKYACGPASDAFSFIIKTTEGGLLTPIKLSEEFRTNNLTVKIRYKNTGKLTIPFTAPNYEQIEIIQMSRSF